jgi:hypothetical protein
MSDKETGTHTIIPAQPDMAVYDGEHGIFAFTPVLAWQVTVRREHGTPADEFVECLPVTVVIPLGPWVIKRPDGKFDHYAWHDVDEATALKNCREEWEREKKNEKREAATSRKTTH